MSPTTASLSEQDAEKIRTFVEHLRNCKDAPAFTVGVATGAGPVFTEAFGQADRDEDRAATQETLFAIGSTTKAFTSMIIAMLIDQQVGK